MEDIKKQGWLSQLGELYESEDEFDNMGNIQFVSTNYETNETTTIEFVADGTIEQMVKKFRAFLMAEAFTEGLVDEWIVNPYGF